MVSDITALGFCHWYFVIRICFVFRISDLNHRGNCLRPLPGGFLRPSAPRVEHSLRGAMENELHAVTGAFGYSGKYIAKRLIDERHRVITITNSLDRKSPFGDKIKVFPFNFDEPEKLEETFQGVSVLYNTYWVRFNHKTFTHADAVRNTEIMFKAAKKAGVKK